MAGQRLERRSAGAMTNEAIRHRGNRARSLGDGGVGNAEKYDVRVPDVRASTEWAVDFDARGAKRRRERVADASSPDDGDVHPRK